MLINVETKQRVSEAEFRKSLTDVSLPAILTDRVLEKFGHANLQSPPKPNVGDFESAVDSGHKLVKGEWQIEWKVLKESPQAKQVRYDSNARRVNDEVQHWLDMFAKTRGYIDMVEACSFASSSVPKYKTEGTYCKSVRDEVWATVDQLTVRIKGGKLDVPNGIAGIFKELPPLKWPTK